MSVVNSRFRLPAQNILVATDFSAASQPALRYATELAHHFDATLYVGHVVDSGRPEGESAPGSPVSAVAEQEAGSHAARRIPLPHNASYQLLAGTGPLWPTICEMLEDRQIDILVLGTYGRRGLEKLVFGSKADEILIHAICPVVLVGPELSTDPQPNPIPQNLLYAADFNVEGDVARNYACALARSLDARLFFLHVTEDVSQEPLSTKLSPGEFFRLRLKEKGCAPMPAAPEPVCLVEYGPPEDRIIEVAQTLKMDMIVLGFHVRHHASFSGRMPGPKAYDIGSHSPCPVIGVPID